MTTNKYETHFSDCAVPLFNLHFCFFLLLQQWGMTAFTHPHTNCSTLYMCTHACTYRQTDTQAYLALLPGVDDADEMIPTLQRSKG